MSYERAMRAFRLQMPDRIPHTEHVTHPELIRRLTGSAPARSWYEGDDEAWGRFFQTTDYDFLWFTDDGPPWEGRTTSMGHAEFQADGPDFDTDVHCPFPEVDDVLAFDPVAEYGLPDVDKRAGRFQSMWNAMQSRSPFMVIPGGYYKTLFSACIHAFGWEMFLASGGTDEERFDRVLDGFFQITMRNVEAWARTECEVFIQHDDIAWTSGAVFPPAWYRKHIFPRYAELWKVLHEAGKTVLYCSDGDYTEFIDDVAAAGADGFLFEPMTDLEYVVDNYGDSKVIIGNIDTRVLTFGSPDEVRAEVARCAELGLGCPGYFFCVGNHIPPNVPIENALVYFDAIREMGVR